MKFGNDNPLLPGQLQKGKSYIDKDGKILKFTGTTHRDDFKVYYNFSYGGRGNYAMTHDEVLDNVTYLPESRQENKMNLQTQNKLRKSSEVKLRQLIERLIREESTKIPNKDLVQIVKTLKIDGWFDLEDTKKATQFIRGKELTLPQFLDFCESELGIRTQRSQEKIMDVIYAIAGLV